LESNPHSVYVQTCKPGEGVVVYAELSTAAYNAQTDYDLDGLFSGVAAKRLSRVFLETKFAENSKIGAAMTKIRHLERKLFAAENVLQNLVQTEGGVSVELRDQAQAYLDDLAGYKTTHMSNRSKVPALGFTYDLDENGGIPQNFMHTHLEWAGSAKTAYNQARLHFNTITDETEATPFILQSKRYYVYTHKIFEDEEEALADLRVNFEFIPRRQTVGCYLIKSGGYLFFLPELARRLV